MEFGKVSIVIFLVLEVEGSLDSIKPLRLYSDCVVQISQNLKNKEADTNSLQNILLLYKPYLTPLIIQTYDSAELQTKQESKLVQDEQFARL